ncbi:MAG: hypothetical protein KDB27_26300, partial [Planctomycetales bacterium]|nr:hypothetical protein [Planctomycetales bacterium]
SWPHLKGTMMRTTLTMMLMLMVSLAINTTTQAQVRLLGITGLQGDADQEAFPDAALFEISIEDGSAEKLYDLTFIPDTHAIGFNPEDGLVYHTGGSESWTDDPSREGGFGDHQYMETVNLETGELTPIFNANPPESPDDFPSFGLAAPLPSFIAPGNVRLIDDPDCEDEAVPGICPRERGEDEYHGLRGLTWSNEEKLFYGSDELGIFKLTPSGEATFVGQPIEDARDSKGITFYEKDGVTSLLLGNKKNGNLWTIDPENGDQVDDPVELEVPPESEFDLGFDGVLALAQHPETGVLYGIRRTDPEVSSAFERELITIDPVTGETHLVGNTGLHFASLTFATSTRVPGDYNGNGVIDSGDLDVHAQYIAAGDLAGDVNGDGATNVDDRAAWAEQYQNSWLGDSNFDGEFSSGDFVMVFGTAKYETGEAATYAEGDWNGDMKFDSGDFVAVFTTGGYEEGQRGVAAVPEPTTGLASLAALVLFIGNVVRKRIR